MASGGEQAVGGLFVGFEPSRTASGPSRLDSVRDSSKSTKKPPPAIVPGDESKATRQHAASAQVPLLRRLDAVALALLLQLVDLLPLFNSFIFEGRHLGLERIRNSFLFLRVGLGHDDLLLGLRWD